jgi:hypothetical protein
MLPIVQTIIDSLIFILIYTETPELLDKSR